MVKEIGMTNKQFQGFIRLALGWLEKALEETPENKSLQALKDIFQSMLEDDQKIETDSQRCKDL